ncbi:MAG: hypothetical protein U0271_21125 [Polyangiaceae bacterium]
MSHPRHVESRRKGHEEPRPPVVMVTCPSCGGGVRDAELGERTRCTYCGTDLHLPTVEFPESEPAPPPSTPPAESRPARAKAQDSKPPGFLLVLAAGCVVFLVYELFATDDVTASKSPSPEQHAIPNGGAERADCMVGCYNPCLNIKDTNEMVACTNKCTDKCRHVGRGSSTECRSRCDSLCQGAPDATSRAACLSGCSSDCQ